MGSRGQGSGANSALTSIVGRKGKAQNYSDAQRGTNPNYRKGNGNYHENCQRCVTAYELRRRGYKVEALPFVNDEGNKNWYNAFEGQKWKFFFANRQTTAINDIEKEVKSWGDGARGMVRWAWKGKRYGHVINVENRNGGVFYIDAQTNSQDYSAKAHLYDFSPSSVMVSRVDNLNPNTKYLDKIVKRS